jgi:hypothetical protein
VLRARDPHRSPVVCARRRRGRGDGHRGRARHHRRPARSNDTCGSGSPPLA